MDKVLEALKNLLPAESVKDISEAVAQVMDDAISQAKKEYGDKLEDAYAELGVELAEAESTANEGYKEAWGIIQDLRSRLELQKEEFDKAMQEGYEEAYQELVKERQKNETLADSLHEEYTARYDRVKEFMIDKIDEFLKVQGTSIYEQARRDILNDPRLAEDKVVLDRIVDLAVSYASDGDFSHASSSKIEEMNRSVDQLKSQVRLLEGRNVKLSTENTKLSEQVRIASDVISEAREVNLRGHSRDKKERASKAKNVSGRGRLVTEGVVPEYRVDKPANDRRVVNEQTNPELYQLQVLAGVRTAD